MFEKLFMKSLLYSKIYINVSITFCVTYYRDALIATHPNVKSLMCYFHTVNCCKNLRSHPAATQKQICEDVHYLHSSNSQIEFESRDMEVAGNGGEISQTLNARHTLSVLLDIPILYHL
jgi:hypothetical protein